MGSIPFLPDDVQIPQYSDIALVALAVVFWILFIRSLAIAVSQFFIHGLQRGIAAILSTVYFITLLINASMISFLIIHELEIHEPFLRNDHIAHFIRLFGSYGVLFLNFTINCLILLSLFTFFSNLFGLQFNHTRNKNKCIAFLFICIALYFLIILTAAILIEVFQIHYLDLKILSFIHAAIIFVNIIISLICIYKLPIMEPLDLSIGLYRVNTKCTCCAPITRYSWSISIIPILQSIGLAIYILDIDMWNIDSRTAKFMNILRNRHVLLIFFTAQFFMLLCLWSFVRITVKESIRFYIIVDALKPQIQNVPALVPIHSDVDSPSVAQIFVPHERDDQQYTALHTPVHSQALSDEEHVTHELVEVGMGVVSLPDVDVDVTSDQAQHVEDRVTEVELVSNLAVDDQAQRIAAASLSYESEHFGDVERDIIIMQPQKEIEEDTDAKMDEVNTTIAGELVRNESELSDDDDEEEAGAPPVPPIQPAGDGFKQDKQPPDTPVDDGEDMSEMKQEVMDTVTTKGEGESADEDAPAPPPPPVHGGDANDSGSMDLLQRMLTPEAPPPVEEQPEQAEEKEKAPPKEEHDADEDINRELPAMVSISAMVTTMSTMSEVKTGASDHDVMQGIMEDSQEDNKDKQEEMEDENEREDTEEIEREILEPIEQTLTVENEVEVDDTMDKKEDEMEENAAEDETLDTGGVDSVKEMESEEVEVATSVDGTEVVNHSDESGSDESSDDSNENEPNEDATDDNKPPPNIILEF
eukprot:129597_1